MKKCLFFSLILLSCNTQDFLLSSTYQHWVGGRKESGSGTNYKFTLIAPADNLNFSVTSIYAHDRSLRFSVYPKKFTKGDTLFVNGSKSNESWESSNSIGKLEYEYFDKKYALPIKKLTKLEKLHYP